MKVFIQDHGWAGASVVVAENEEQARDFLRLTVKNLGSLMCFYDDSKPFDEVIDCTPGSMYEVFGDR